MYRPFFVRYRIDEVLMQVVNKLQQPVLERGAHAHVIEDRQMLHIFAEADTPGVRAHRNSELLGHQKHGKNLVHSTQTATVDLTERDRFGLQQLLEDDTVLAILTCRPLVAGIMLGPQLLARVLVSKLPLRRWPKVRQPPLRRAHGEKPLN